MCKLKKCLASWMSVIVFISCLISPETAMSISIKQEKELSDEFLLAVFAQLDVIEDPVINDYINKVGQKILSSIPYQPFTYKFYAVHQDVYNAFAGPAGNIFIFSGLFIALENENELAALLSHEIAHVTCRHISEMIAQSKRTNMATLAGVIAGILIGLGGASAVGSAMTIGSMAAGQSFALAYSRENEIQADQIGRNYLQQAGYDLDGLLSVLKKIRAVDWFDTGEIPTYMRTHPATEDRIMYLDNLLGNKTPRPIKENFEFERAHTRMVALYGDPETAIRIFKDKIEKQPDSFMAQHGYGLALARNGNPKAAINHLSIALKINPRDPYVKMDLGKAFYLAGEYKKALDIFSNSMDELKESASGYLYLGRTQVALNLYDKALDSFNTVTKNFPENIEVYYFLGETYGKMENLAAAHFNLGLYYKKKMDRKTANFHLNKALELEKNKEQIEKINQALEELNKRPSFWGTSKNEEKEKSTGSGKQEKVNN